MKISTILDHIDSGHMALPEFQRGYVWNRDQVRGLMASLYQRHPVGSLLVWATESLGAQHRGDGALATGVVKLLLDGQQRITTLYGIVRGSAPRFFDGEERTFRGLRFHLEREEFAFFSPVVMKDDPLWIDITTLMTGGASAVMDSAKDAPELKANQWTYIERVQKLRDVRDIDLHIEEVTGSDKTIDVVVDIFNRVNSGGTKLSKGDLALAKICATVPDARDRMKATLSRWRDADYHFNLDWLLRVANTVTTGEAKFNALHEIDANTFNQGLSKSEQSVDYLLNAISGRFGLDHDRVLFGRYALPVMARYLQSRGGHIDDEVERDKLLFWYLQNAMWGRFSGSTETTIDKDLKVIQTTEGGLDRLLNELRLWRGNLAVEADHFGGWSLGARFYPVLYLLTRTGAARDWGTGLALKANLLGKMSQLEMHHIFPKAHLYKAGYKRPQVNAIANFCFLTKDTNIRISDEDPEKYLGEVEERHPGALASQWVPTDPSLWRTENYLAFLEARKALLANATNRLLEDLLHGDAAILRRPGAAASAPPQSVPGGVDDPQEEAALLALNEWVVQQGLPEGSCLHELADDKTGEPRAILDLAWPNGLQQGYSRPVAVLLNELPETLAVANQAGFRYFSSIDAFKTHVEREVLARELPEAPEAEAAE